MTGARQLRFVAYAPLCRFAASACTEESVHLWNHHGLSGIYPHNQLLALKGSNCNGKVGHGFLPSCSSSELTFFHSCSACHYFLLRDACFRRASVHLISSFLQLIALTPTHPRKLCLRQLSDISTLKKSRYLKIIGPEATILFRLTILCIMIVTR